MGKLRDLLVMAPGPERDNLQKKLGAEISKVNYNNRLPAKFKDETCKDIVIKGDPANKHKKELEIEKEICAYLASLKIQFWNMKIKGEVQSIGRGRAILKASKNQGFPDILCCVSGMFLGIEVKRPGGKQSIYQQQMQKIIEKAGGYYVIVTSVKEIDTFLREKEWDMTMKISC